MTGRAVDRRRREEGKRARYVNTGQASELLDGFLSAQQIRQMALAGEIPGAKKVRSRVLVPRHVLAKLVTELEFAAPPARPKIVRNTFDGIAS